MIQPLAPKYGKAERGIFTAPPFGELRHQPVKPYVNRSKPKGNQLPPDVIRM